MFQFIHAADIHLDSPLRGLDQYEGAPVQEIRNAARRALENLVELAIERKVAFVLIAGDVYDGDWPDVQTGFFFVRQASRLREHGIPLYVISGNHDAANRMTRSLRLPDNVTYFPADAPDSVSLPELGVVIHGQSFARAAIYEDLSESYPLAHPGLFNIGLLHTCATGRDGHERYAPCSVEGLTLKGYNYWALGHIHKRETLARDPFIAFPGNIQGRHARETGPKGCLLVTVDDDHSIHPEFCPLDVCRWENRVIDISEARDLDEVLERVSEQIQLDRHRSDGRTLALRLVLDGASPAHRESRAKRAQLTDEIRALAIDIGKGDVWIEKVNLSSQPAEGPRPLFNADSLPDGAIEYLSSVFERAKRDTSYLEELGFDCGDIMKKLPSELKHLADTGQTVWLHDVVADAECNLLRRLVGTEADE